MNKFYVLAGTLFAGLALHAQVKTPNQSFEEAKGLTETTLSAKALGVQLWSSDFSTASDWSASEGPGHTLGEWEIETTIPAGFSSVSTSTGTFDFSSIWASESGGEFAIVNSDEAGSGQEQRAYLETGDLTIATDIVAAGGTVNDAVSLRWIQMFRKFQESHAIEVSVDGGATWTPYVVNDVGVNVNSNLPTQDPATITTFLTVPAAAAWTDQTRFRLYYEGAWDWFWVVDDFSVSTLPDFDLAATENFWGSGGINFTDGTFQPIQYHAIPNAQIQEHQFIANVFNNGSADLTNATLTLDVNAGASTEMSNVSALLTPGQADTLTAVFTPMADNTYDFAVTLATDEVDDVPVNNFFQSIPTITTGGDIYRRDNDDVDGFGGGDDPDGNFGYEAGNYFDIVTDATLHSIDVGIASEAVNEGVEIYAILYLDDGGSFTAQAVSEFYIVSAADLDNVARIYLDTPFDLVAGNRYFAAVGASEEFYYQTAGNSPSNTSLIYYPTMANPTTQFFTSNTPVVRMNFEAPSVSLDELADNLSLAVYPNPASNNVNATFSLDNASEVTVQITDLAGKAIYTNALGKIAAGAHKVNVPTTSLSDGVYFYTISVNNTVATEKLVIKK